MAEWFRVMRLLIHKNFLVRKRQWAQCLFSEILLPLLIIVSTWAVRNYSTRPPVYIDTTTYYNSTPFTQLFYNLYGNKTFYYTPNNTLTNSLMKQVVNCFQTNSRYSVFNATGFESEEELLMSYSKYWANDTIMGGVIFDKDINESTKHHRYKIRPRYLNEMPLYNALFPVNGYYKFVIENNFAQTQICLDHALIAQTSKNNMFTPEFNMFIQQMPQPPYIQTDTTDTIFRQVFVSLLVTAFLIPLFIETANASNEKFLGVSVLMSMNGVSNGLNLFSWLLSGAIFIIIFCALPIFLLLLFSIANALPYIYYGNPLVIWVIIMAHIFHLLSYGIHVSAYVPKPLYVVFVLLVLNIGGLVLQQHVIKEDTFPIVPYLGIIFPNMLLYRAVDELNYYETLGEGNQWYNIFKIGVSDYKFAGCMGMVLIFSIIGSIFHFTMAVYVYAINPGKYGVKKDLLFFLKMKDKINSDEEIENSESNIDNGKLFESVPRGTYVPGIQIRNLKKSYQSGVFNKTEVKALRGVSVDFYKGQITSLLGHNGAGKTTMMSILTGMMSPSSGLVLVNSKNLKEYADEIMNDMGLCTQENMLFPSLSVGEQLEFFAKLKRGNKTNAEIERDVKYFLDKLKLYDKRNTLPKNLSGGQKRRVCLGMALIGDPNILILDEPTSGLDPESRRVIWDMLLKMRGQKTILISTHDMEEADILGDRIAILHTGELKSYGTSMFLKKIIGEDNIEVTLSVEPWCDVEKVRFELNCEGKVINKDGTKLVITIPNTPDMPESLDNLERKKEELGISGLSVSIISLEQVFLKVTEENSEPVKDLPSSHKIKKVASTQRVQQTIRALLHKKLMYTVKNISTVLIMLFLAFIGLLCISLIMKQTSVTKQTINVVDIKLEMYKEPETFYKSFVKNIGEYYRLITQRAHGNPYEVQEDNVNNELVKYAQLQKGYFDTHAIAAAEVNNTVNGTAINALYSSKLSYSIPISINLLSNSIVKSLAGDDYSISVSSQRLPSISSLIYSDNTIMNAAITSVIFVFIFFSLVALFVLHPMRETTTTIKHLQRMAGVSSSMYWGTMFLFDLIVFLIIIILVAIGFKAMDYFLDLRVYSIDEIMILVLCFAMFAINALPLVYIFSFVNVSTTNMIRILTYVPIGFVLLEAIMYAINITLQAYKAVRTLRKVQKYIFLFVPYVSFFHSQISFYLTAQNNARCKRMPEEFYATICVDPYANDVCCYTKCQNGVCENPLKYFGNFEEDVSLELSLLYLLVSPLLYFGILAIIEHKLIQQFVNRYKKYDIPEKASDEQVNNEKKLIADKIYKMMKESGYTSKNEVNGKLDGQNTISENSRHTNDSNNEVFLVYGLRKKYGALLAVQDINFRVSQSQCFGLLGVNGAGKSTTFKMMTGGELPDNGLLYVGDKEINIDRQYYLSQMGYCPQHDAIIKSLNAYEHLKLFARLRGIPEDQVESEVDAWIHRLNLVRCASQPSGTYSGGNKRRLNIAIALIGIPSLVLLDEPTTGVDPGARRSLWNVIQSCQTTGQAVVLTSHSMEECEALCNRLAIMVAGRLVCIGPSEELKQRFGAGYDIQIKMDPEKAKSQTNSIKADMEASLNCKLVDENAGYLMYHVSPDDITWRKMYSTMDVMRSKYDCIDDFSVLSSSLEQLFLLFAKAANNDSKSNIE